METTLTVGRLSTEQFNAPQITLSTSVKSCSHSRGWKVSPDITIQHNIQIKTFLIDYSMSVFCDLIYRFSGGLGRGGAEDRDPAEQSQ